MQETRQQQRARIESFEYLNRFFSYDPLTGQVCWKVRWPGRGAGTQCKGGYWKIAIEKLDFKFHRIAWVLHYKNRPDDGLVIDHINGNPGDNRIINLRLCKQKDNSRNQKVTQKNSSTGFKGVSLMQGGRFRAYIGVNRKQIYLGMFDTPELAYEEYKKAALKHFGEFARV